MAKRNWTDIQPQDALDLTLPNGDIQGPFNKEGIEGRLEDCEHDKNYHLLTIERWDPPQLAERPIGQYHCLCCGAMVLAGIHHLDYREG